MDQRTDCRCKAGGDCTARTAEGPAATAVPESLCRPCIFDISHRVKELPLLSAALRVFLGGGLKTAIQSKVNATKEPAPPLNLIVFTLLDDIDEALAFLGDGGISELVKRPPEPYEVWRDGKSRRVYLTGADRALWIRRVHLKATDTLGFAPVFTRRHAPCPQCGLPCLGSWSGSDVIECNNNDCGVRFTPAQYQEYCNGLAHHG